MQRASSLVSRIVASSKRCFSTDGQTSKINYTIHKYEHHLPVEKSAYSNINVELDDIELCLFKKNITVNLTWLRDSCHCKKCTHRSSKQRLITPKDFRRHMFEVKEVRLLDGTYPDECCLLPSDGDSSNKEHLLIVDWADGHQSRYSVNWLHYLDSIYGNTQLHVSECSNKTTFALPRDGFYLSTSGNTINSLIWDVKDIKAKLKPVDYNVLLLGNNASSASNEGEIKPNVMDEDLNRLNALTVLTKQLVTYGLAKIINVPQEKNQVLQVARSIAYERPTGYGVVFDVTVEPSEDINLAYSSLEFDLHTDLPYRETSPGVQLLHCIRNSKEGGLSFFADSFKAAAILRQTNPTLFEVLVRFPVSFFIRDPYRNSHFRSHKPTINLDTLGNLSEVYYSPFTLPPIGHRDDVKLFYLAMDKFTQLIHSVENKLVDKMEPGDLYIFHNRRVLHGRSSYDPNTPRLLQGCYMDWDEITFLSEKLHSC